VLLQFVVAVHAIVIESLNNYKVWVVVQTLQPIIIIKLKDVRVCKLVPLRFETSDRSEIVSQILFGEHFEILEQNNNEVKFKIL
jgi:hypothetical protein